MKVLALRLLLVIALLGVLGRAQHDDYDDEHDVDDEAGSEFVDEILREEQDHYGDDDPYYDETAERARQEEERIRLQQEEEQRRAEAERLAAEEAERMRIQREKAFERELGKMNEEQAKAARKQKKRDAQIVHQILRAAKRGDHYRALGLFYKEVRIPERVVGIGKFCAVRIPAFAFFRISPKAIRQAYRKRSLRVHPDRNRDGRAQEAFVALEEAASVLSDEVRRAEYDERLRAERRKRRRDATAAAMKAVDGTLRVTGRAVAVVRQILGPFALPCLIVGSLIV